MLIFGEDGDLQISGIWIFRGHQFPEELKECDDSEVYEWKIINHEDFQTRESIQDYFAWDGKFGGKTKPFNQGKVFK